MAESTTPTATVISFSRQTTYAFRRRWNKSSRRTAFWEHAGQFPMHRKRPVRLMETEFLSALAFGSNERILENKATTFPFEDAQIERLIRVFQDLRGPPDAFPSRLLPALSYHIARTMLAVAAARERYAYGTRNARMYRDTAIPPPTPQMWVWDFFLGVILCGTHKNYRVRLEATVPKGVVGLPEFRGLMRGLMSEWADSNLVATVLVSVNVGFLAVPDIRSPQRSFAVVSSLCAMTSIVTGLHHVWQHREKTDIEREDARQYLYFLDHCLHRRQNKDIPAAAPDLTLTASLLALPLATLQWSVLSFTLAIATYAVQTTSAGEGRILFAVLLAVLGVLALGVFLFFWRIWAGPVHVEMEMEEIEGDGKGGGVARMRNVNLAIEGAGVGWVGTVVGRLWVRVGRLRGKRAERDREGGA
ncbi:hypothetical protein DFH08DRAFT_342554 [Mycena albidolilacea]|uniref:Uncharacterized protein n=1 Tax=Mycena albidolilacea TaxID=1033008 RepID=A0AAD7EIW5_9AGAR|nr:hypothetical protein DFH08DRAFT_342554 [Mycena albidolilacea]